MAAVDVVDDYVSALPGKTRRLAHAEWGITEKNRRAKFYRLTTAGRRQLAAEVSRWSRYAIVVQLVLDSAAAG